jgi:DNA polymerase I-like protein with 3'-5' exonuclease and polymerase domains
MLAAAFTFVVPTMDSSRKEEMRELAITRWQFTSEERVELMDYCAEDVDITGQLFNRMTPLIDWPRALLRGRYGLAVARMERTGVPINTTRWNYLDRNWQPTLHRLIDLVSAKYDVFTNYEVDDRKLYRFAADRGLLYGWPQTSSGPLQRDKKTMKQLALLHPDLNELKELLNTLGSSRLLNLAIGPDGYNRTGLIPFRAVTGRNQPSSAAYIFGPATWLRGHIMAKLGEAVAYLDFSAEEVCIIAVLSGDENLLADCRTGDPYIAFAIRAGMVPVGATKASHTAERDLVKVLFLSLNYGRSVHGLALALGWPVWAARDLWRKHEEAYPQLHRWLQGVIDAASIRGWQHSAFGWRRFVPEDFNPRSIRNWPCQTLGFEILMLAAILLTEAGIEVCAPAHDAFLIKAPLDRIESVVAEAKAIMEAVSEVVTGGFRIPVDHKIYPHGTRYMDKRGQAMWDRVWDLLDYSEDGEQAVAA